MQFPTFKNKKTVRERVDARKAEQKKLKSLNFSSFLIDVKHNPMILIGLGGSALFTSLAGLFIGFAPHRVNDAILFFGGNDPIDAVVGVFFGLLYAAMFPILGEWGVYYWHKKASLRDEGNVWQTWISYSMLVLTAIFMTVTAIFASTILASLLGAFRLYREIPPAAQVWTVTIIPIGLALHAFANIWYDHKSAAAEERRELERELQQTELEAEGRIREAKVKAKERAAIAHAEEYERLAEVEAVQAGQNKAKAAWSRDKIELGADAYSETPEAVAELSDADHNNGNHPT